jgi:hypothetical protein
MEEKELLELLEVFSDKVKRVVALSNEIVAHPVYPHASNRQVLAESILTIQNSLTSSLITTIGQLDFGIEGMGKTLATFEENKEGLPDKKPLN